MNTRSKNARESAKRYVKRKFSAMPPPYSDWMADVYLDGFEAGRREMGRQVAEKRPAQSVSA